MMGLKQIEELVQNNHIGDLKAKYGNNTDKIEEKLKEITETVQRLMKEEDENYEAIKLMIEDLDNDTMRAIAYDLGWYGAGDDFFDNLRNIFDSIGRFDERILYYKNKLEGGVNNG